MFKVLITTAGTGSRLGKATSTTNKALLEIAGKKVIDRIIESYNKSIPLVISLGYFGNKVKEYVIDKYPDREIKFVFVDPYEGPGSSLGFSMLATKEYLQCPFIFHCNDTIVMDDIPTPENSNWDGISSGDNPEIFNSLNYSSVLLKKKQVLYVQAKGAKSFDGFHIGLVGVKNYDLFWNILEMLYIQNPKDSTLNDCSVISVMLDKQITFSAVEFSNWFDTGNSASLQQAIQKLERFV